MKQALFGRSRRVVKHPEPAWAERADCEIVADISDRGMVPSLEALACAVLEDDRYTVACIPFFATDIALGDTITVDDEGRARRVETSGHTVFRVWFGDSAEPLTRLEVDAKMSDFGAQVEKFSEDLIAIDAETELVSERVFGYLEAEDAAGRLAFETGHTS